MIEYLTGIKTNPPRHIDSEYRRLKSRSIGRGSDNFTPSDGYEDLSAAGLLRAFLMNPLEGVIKRK